MLFLFVWAAGVVIEEKNWPPFFPIIHHDITNEIPIHLQKMLYVAFTTWLGMFKSYILKARYINITCMHIIIFEISDII